MTASVSIVSMRTLSIGLLLLVAVTLGSVLVLGAAELTLEKTVTTLSGSCPGSTSLTVDEGDGVKYCYTVRNTGDAAARDLWLMDDNGTPASPSDFSDISLSGLTDEDGDGASDDLAPGAEATGDLQWLLDDPGTVTNTALIQGYDIASGTLISDTDAVSVTVNDLVAVLELTKTATTSSGTCPGSKSLTVNEGDGVKYCYTVRNTGTAAARDLWLMDDNGTPASPSDFSDISLSGLTDEDGDGASDDLAPGAEATGDLQWLLDDPGTETNTAIVQGYDVTSANLISDSDTMTVTVNDLVAWLEIGKSVCVANGTCPGSKSLTIDEGDTVKYCVVVVNSGTAALRDVIAWDDAGTSASTGDDVYITLSGLTDEDGDGSSDDLAPGATATGDWQVTHDYPGVVTNTAEAQGVDLTSGTYNTDTSSATVTVNDLVAWLEIGKSVCVANGTCPGSKSLTIDEGDTVKYCVVVVNSGTAALRDVIAWDDAGTPASTGNDIYITLSGLTDEDGDGSSDDLAPGATATGDWQVTHDYPGVVTNTAEAQGVDLTSGTYNTDTSSATVTVDDRVAELEITKTVTTQNGSCPGSASLTVDEGDTVKYCYVVENTGDAAVRDLRVFDDEGMPGNTNPPQITMSGLTDEDGDGDNDDLAPGATATGGLQMTLPSPGPVTNTATASGQDVTSGGDVYDSDSVTVTVNDRVAVLEIAKTASEVSGTCPGSKSLTVDEGDTVLYCYVVENTGDAAVRDLRVFDDEGMSGNTNPPQITMSGLTDEDGDGDNDDLAPGATATGGLQMTLPSPGPVTNTATASGQDVTSGGDVYDSDSVTVTVNDRVAVLEIVKTASEVSGSCPGSKSLTVGEGDMVLYCYVVENTGDAAVRDLRVFDDEGMPGNTNPPQITMSGLTDEDGDGSSDDLAPGATATGGLQMTLMSPGPTTNTATASGQDVTSSGDVSDTDSVTVTVNDRVAVLEVTKTVSVVGGSCPGSTSLAVDEGDMVLYCYEVENTGDAAALNVTVVDDNGTPGFTGDDETITLTGLSNQGGGQSKDLAPGASASGGWQTTLSAPGSVTNTAYAEGTDVTSYSLVSDDDSITVTVTNTPPVIHDCPDNQFVSNPGKQPSVVVNWTPPTATDSSGAPPTLTTTHNPGDNFPVGLTVVTYTATDAQGATDTCAFEIIVENHIPPVVEIHVPEDDGIYFVGERVPAEWTVTSNVDLASIVAATDAGQLLDTSQGGSFRFRVTATDVTGLSTTESAIWTVLYLLRPPADAAGWTEEWLWIDNVLPLNERMLIGSVPISGVYTSGDPVKVFFSLCDVHGHGLRDCIASLSVTRAHDPEDDTRYEDLLDYMLKFYTFRFDAELDGYHFELQTFGYQPGYYDLWITVDSVLQQRVRIQILENDG